MRALRAGSSITRASLSAQDISMKPHSTPRLCQCIPFVCRVKALLESAHKKLSYLRIVTPRARADDDLAAANASAAASAASAPAAGVNRYVMGTDGRLINLAEAGGVGQDGQSKLPSYLSSFQGGNIDPDALRRHESSLRRMQFMDRGTSTPLSPWKR